MILLYCTLTTQLNESYRPFFQFSTWSSTTKELNFERIFAPEDPQQLGITGQPAGATDATTLS